MNPVLSLTAQQLAACVGEKGANLKPPGSWSDPSARFFHTKPCRHCSDTRRYIKGKACPTCKSAENARKKGDVC